MWATKKEEHAWMVKAKLDDFRQLNWNIVNLFVVKEIICSFQVQNVRSVLRSKQIYLDSPTINKNFKLPTKGITILAR
jgi:hypothetical protein